MTGHPVHVAEYDDDVPQISFEDAASRRKALHQLLQLQPQNGSQVTAIHESVNSNVTLEVGSSDLVEKYSILDYPFKAYLYVWKSNCTTND